MPGLCQAGQDLHWLLNRGYALRSAVELVGNRYALAARQRVAVARCVCADEARRRRRAHELEPEALQGRALWLDGLNVLTGIEAALAGGVILGGYDRCFRDLASVHARHHEVEETIPAIQLIGAVLSAWGVHPCWWWLDRPVSNSGRLKKRLLEMAAANEWDWRVELVFNPDRVLAESEEAIATADSAILDRCRGWVNLTRRVILERVPKAWIVNLRPSEWD